MLPWQNTQATGTIRGLNTLISGEHVDNPKSFNFVNILSFRNSSRHCSCYFKREMMWCSADDSWSPVIA